MFACPICTPVGIVDNPIIATGWVASCLDLFQPPAQKINRPAVFQE